MNEYDSNVSLIDNCISEKEQDILENYVCNSRFPWGFCEGTILKSDIKYTNSCIIERGINPPQFSHFVSVNNNPNIVFFQSIFNFIATHYNTNIHILKCQYITSKFPRMLHFTITSFQETLFHIPSLLIKQVIVTRVYSTQCRIKQQSILWK